MVYGFQSSHASTRLSWLLEQRAEGGQIRAVSLNQLALDVLG